MREEEKLARDVYLTLYDRCGQKIFANIAKSEQTHTNTIQGLLTKYGIDDPVKSETIGEFANEILLGLYNDLLETGNESLINALIVGAAIEEIDILDLQKELEHVSGFVDITTVYNNLMRGSRNHLRSFVSNLKRQGIVYEPQYLDKAEYDTIISGSTETGP